MKVMNEQDTRADEMSEKTAEIYRIFLHKIPH